MLISRPLKAPNKTLEDNQLSKLPYPVVGSPKLDGIRCLIDGTAKTSSMKGQPNPFVQQTLSRPEFNGLDGELIIGKPNSPSVFNNSTGPLRRKYDEPDFRFYIFDIFLFPVSSYKVRWINVSIPLYPRVTVISQTYLASPSDVIEYTKLCIEDGYEGAMLRTLTGLYKQGRATFNEMNIFKRKPLTDAEAMIIGFTEQQTNLNPKFIDEMGLTKRATNQDMKVGAGTLGNFILQSPDWKKPFYCGGGCLLHFERKEIWDNKEKFLGEIITYKYQQYGSIDAPRQPIFKRFYQEF